MNRPSDVSVELGVPRHGWLPISLKFGTHALDVYASGVLNDPVEELVAVQKGRVGVDWVWLWEEPSGFVLRAAHDEAGWTTVSYWEERYLAVGRRPEREPIATVRCPSMWREEFRAHLRAWAIEHQEAIREHWSDADYLEALR